MKKFFEEFKAFVLKGNVMNLAVGVIIGAAFQSVVTSLTTNILAPIVGVFAGQNFDSLQVDFLGVTLKYGSFITSVINFVIMAFVIFLLVKVMNKLFAPLIKDAAAEEPTTQKCPYCISEIDIKATRCPNCTSEVSSKEEEVEEEEVEEEEEEEEAEDREGAEGAGAECAEGVEGTEGAGTEGAESG